MSDDQRIAIVGASSDRSKYGNIAVRAYLEQGWEVFPVNPKGGEIEGLTVMKDLADLPDGIERISVYLPPRVLLSMLDGIAAKKPGEVWLNPGTESPEVLEKARALGLNVIQACSIVDQGVTPADFQS